MKKAYLFLGAIILIHLLLLLNLQFTAWPEMFSYAYLKNNGYWLYKDMIHPYPPLLTLGLSWVYKLFGYKVEVLKILTWGVILLNDLLIFKITKKLTNNVMYSLVSVLIYSLTQPFLEGNMLWFDLAIVPTVLLGMYFFISERTIKNLLLSGLFFGLATFTKQTAGLFILIVLTILVIEKVKPKKLITFISGPLVIFLTLLVRLIQEGAVLRFFNSSLINPILHWSNFPGYVQFNLHNRDFLILSILLIPVFISIYQKTIFKDKNTIYLSVFLFLSALLVYPRFSYFHLQLFIALTVILFGYSLEKTKSKIIILAIPLILFFISYPSLKMNWRKHVRFFSEVDLEQANLIKQNTSQNENIYLLGLNSNLYPMTQTLPTKPWTDNFGWYLEIPGTQEEILKGWDENPPSKVFWREAGHGNWFDLGVYEPKKITEWINSNYKKSEKIDSNIWMWEKIK